jgi:hypothetical protein
MIRKTFIIGKKQETFENVKSSKNNILMDIKVKMSKKALKKNF